MQGMQHHHCSDLGLRSMMTDPACSVTGCVAYLELRWPPVGVRTAWARAVLCSAGVLGLQLLKPASVPWGSPAAALQVPTQSIRS